MSLFSLFSFFDNLPFPFLLLIPASVPTYFLPIIFLSLSLSLSFEKDLQLPPQCGAWRKLCQWQRRWSSRWGVAVLTVAQVTVAGALGGGVLFAHWRTLRPFFFLISNWSKLSDCKKPHTFQKNKEEQSPILPSFVAVPRAYAWVCVCHVSYAPRLLYH